MVSALFGHRRGSFTGAVADAVGKVENDALLLEMNGNVADAETAVRHHRRVFDVSRVRLWELPDNGSERETAKALRRGRPVRRRDRLRPPRRTAYRADRAGRADADFIS